jgi:hypothetical protein
MMLYAFSWFLAQPLDKIKQPNDNCGIVNGEFWSFLEPEEL